MPYHEKITLRDAINITARWDKVHIGTIDGDGWIIKNANTENGAFECEEIKPIIDREVKMTYYHMGRERDEAHCELDPGIAIIVDGNEDGEW